MFPACNLHKISHVLSSTIFYTFYLLSDNISILRLPNFKNSKISAFLYDILNSLCSILADYSMTNGRNKVVIKNVVIRNVIGVVIRNVIRIIIRNVIKNGKFWNF